MTNWYLMLSTVDFDMKKLNEMQESVKNRDADRTTEIDLSNDISQIQSKDPSKNNQRIKSPKNNQSERQYSSAIVQDESGLSDVLLKQKKPKQNLDFQHFRHGDGKARILKTSIKNSYGDIVDYVCLGETIKIDIEIEFLSYQENHLIGVVIRDRLGTEIIGINTYQEKVNIPKVYSGDRLNYSFNFDINIKPGNYGICPSVSYGQYSLKWLDWIDNAEILKVVDSEVDRIVFGLYLPPKREIKITKVKPSKPYQSN